MAKTKTRKKILIDHEEEEFQRLVRKRHIELFPEEYDYMFDSPSDIRDRQKGRSPMNVDHMANVNESRKKMGFEPLSEKGYAVSQDTYRYVEARMRAGKEVDLDKLVLRQCKTEATAHDDEEKSPKGPSEGSNLDHKIDQILAGDAFTYEGQDRTDPKVIAFRVLGALFDVNQSGHNEPELSRQITRLLPGTAESEIKKLCRQALAEWVEVYGY